MSKKSGLDIIEGLCGALQNVADVAALIAKEKGQLLSQSDIMDQRLKDACAKLGQALALATTPDRNKWLDEVDKRVGMYDNWLRESLTYIANNEKNIRYLDYVIPKIKKECIEAIQRLGAFEAKVRKEAEEASQKILKLLD